jgi:hypothetical protein
VKDRIMRWLHRIARAMRSQHIYRRIEKLDREHHEIALELERIRQDIHPLVELVCRMQEAERRTEK